MERKKSLTVSTYKKLSKGNNAWKTVFIAEKPWKEMAVDVDCLIFFFMRKYIDIPYPSRRDQKMVAASFVSNTKQSTEWIVEDIAKYCTKQLVLLLKYLTSIGLVYYPVCSTGYPKLKQDLRDERLRKRKDMERSFLQMDYNKLDEITVVIKKYILYFRDEVRDIVVEHKLKHLRYSTEADKWCGRNHRVVMTEDVDIFLFGDKRTIIVKPFLVENSPTTFHFVDCKSYFKDKGIATYDDFIQVSFMMGTDYNHGIKGMGPKRAVEAIAKYGTVAKYVAVKYDIFDDEVEVLMKRYKKFMEYVRS